MNPRSSTHRSLSPAPLTSSGTPARSLRTLSDLKRAGLRPLLGACEKRCKYHSDFTNALTPLRVPVDDEWEQYAVSRWQVHPNRDIPRDIDDNSSNGHFFTQPTYLQTDTKAENSEDIESKIYTLYFAEANSSSGGDGHISTCLLYTSPSPRDVEESRMPSSA